MIFGRLLGCQEKGFRTKKSAFLFFHVGESKREKAKNIEKEHLKKRQKIVFLSGCEEKCFWVVKMVFFRKMGKHYLCSEGKKARIFVATICFWTMVLFLCPFKVTKHYRNRGFSRYRRKPKMALLVVKVPFGKGPRKGFTICDTPKLCSAENTLFIVFSAKHSFADMNECNTTRKQNITKIGVCLPKCKKVIFFGQCFCFFGGFDFSFLCFCASVCKKAQKGKFPSMLEVFFLFCFPKRPVLKSFFCSYSVFFCFPLSSLQSSILLLCFLSINAFFPETNLASRWEGVRLPRACGKSPDFPGSSPNFSGSFRRLPRKFSNCGTE